MLFEVCTLSYTSLGKFSAIVFSNFASSLFWILSPSGSLISYVRLTCYTLNFSYLLFCVFDPSGSLWVIIERLFLVSFGLLIISLHCAQSVAKPVHGISNFNDAFLVLESLFRIKFLISRIRFFFQICCVFWSFPAVYCIFKFLSFISLNKQVILKFVPDHSS